MFKHLYSVASNLTLILLLHEMCVQITEPKN